MILSLAAEARRTPAEIEAMPFKDCLAWNATLLDRKLDDMRFNAKLAGFEIRS